MPIQHPIAFSGILLSALLLAAQPGLAQYRESDRLILVSPDGHIMRNIPEYGSVRTVIDQYGRRLLVNAWNEVVAIEMTVREYRRDHRRGFERDFERSRRGRDYFPAPPPPPRDGMVSVTPGYPVPESYPDPYRNRDVERRDMDPPPVSGSGIAVVPSPDIPARPDAKPITRPDDEELKRAKIAALQIFLDRNGMSPGVIDGRMGPNVTKALAAWEKASGKQLDPSDSKAVMERLTAAGGSLPFTKYKITAADAAGPYVASIPSDYAEKATLKRLPFTSTAEMLAEKFHMSEAYLRELNPDADFSRPGTIIEVAVPGENRTGKIASIVADKAKKQVRGYNSSGDLVVAYPATIGSSDTPSPSGQVSIERIAHNPGYTYNPKINFKQGDNDEVLELPPGPNGPVGTVWIALSKPTYGIHGTPEPSKIGKTASHGCVRLTNWDAEELASMVKPGVTVMFSN